MSAASNGGKKPRLLDLFCGAGGATRGYQLAGFYVMGVDINAQPNYCGDEFIQQDALSLDREFLDGYVDAVHASPPCQAYTTMSNRWRGSGYNGLAQERPELIGPTRELLMDLGVPWVIENVPGARSSLWSHVTINGPSVGLPRLDRPRLFESNIALLVPPRQRADNPLGVYGKSPDGRLLFRRSDGSEQRAPKSLAEAAAVMGIDWMDWHELKESIPPAYTELIGHQLMQHVQTTVTA